MTEAAQDGRRAEAYSCDWRIGAQIAVRDSAAHGRKAEALFLMALWPAI
jgi:hypothetical protein